MYLSHKGTFVATATVFGLGLFITFLISQNLSQNVTTSSSAQTVPAATPTPAATTSARLTCQGCDVDGSGTVDAADITLLQSKLALSPGNPLIIAMITFCTPFSNPPTPVTSCPAAPVVTVAPGTTASPIPTGSTGSTTPGPTTPGPTGTGGQSGLGDCSSSVIGQKDGFTNLLDFELLRQELSAEVQTTHCDFDANGSVDVIDFTDYLRKGFNS